MLTQWCKDEANHQLQVAVSCSKLIQGYEKCKSRAWYWFFGQKIITRHVCFSVGWLQHLPEELWQKKILFVREAPANKFLGVRDLRLNLCNMKVSCKQIIWSENRLACCSVESNALLSLETSITCMRLVYCHNKQLL